MRASPSGKETGRATSGPSLAAVLGWAFALITAIPALSLAGYLIWDSAQERRAKASAELTAVASLTSHAVEGFLYQHLNGVELFARILGADGEAHMQVEEVQRELTFFSDTYDGFTTMIATDPSGNIVAAAADARMALPQGFAESLRGASVADRDYFQKAIQTRDSFVSDVFSGRGFGAQPIIALSHPVIMGDEVIGVVEGSLNLTRMQEFVAGLELPVGAQLLILDARGNVVYSDAAPERMATVTNWVQSPEARSSAGIASGTFAYRDAAGQRLLGAKDRLASGWIVYLTAPEDAFASAFSAARVSLLLVCGVLVLTGLLARAISRRMTGPVEALVRQVRDDSSMTHSVQPEFHSRFIPRELHELSSAFRERSAWLKSTLAELRVAHSHERELNEQLEQEVASRNQEIEAQTAEIRRQSERLEKVARQAEQASDAKSQFLANMSHEIRTPLAAVIGFIERAQGQPDLHSSTREALAIARRESHHLKRLINDILDLSRIEEGQLQLTIADVQLSSLLSDVMSLEGPAAQEKGLELRFRPHFPLPWSISCDEVRLRQVLTNLLGNAMKFTEHGQITLAVHWAPEQQRIEFIVEDTGIGISEAQQQRLFERFTQADPSVTRRFGGSGLGLSICRHLASLLGGDIRMQSREGTGSIFTLSLPAPDLAQCQTVWHQDSAPVEPSMPAESGPVPGLRLAGHVLIAEDNKTLQMLIRSYVEDLGLSCDVVGNGLQALDACGEENYDLVLMDMHMPEMDGLTATRELKARDPMMPVIALTADVMQSRVARQTEAGCAATVAKPINRTLLTRALAAHLPTARPDDTAAPATGAQRLVDRLRADFVDSLEADYQAPLAGALDAEDKDQLLHLLHQLHGVGGNFGFADLSRFAGEAERLLRSGKAVDTVRPLLGSVQRTLQCIIDADISVDSTVDS